MSLRAWSLPVALLVSSATACASVRSYLRAPSPEPETRYTSAVEALDGAHFRNARADLAWLVGRCEAGRWGRRALLLLAAADLDPRNPHRSPEEAARLAGLYLRLPWAERDAAPLANSLYVLALDLSPGRDRTARRGASSVTVADADPAPARDPLRVATRFEHCDGGGTPGRSRGLPAYQGPTIAERTAELEARLAAQRDSLDRARAHIVSQDKDIAGLRADTARIHKLLRGGEGPYRP